MDNTNDLKDLVDEATFDFTMGDEAVAIEKLEKALAEHPDSFAAWHALAEIQYSSKHYDKALEAAEKAHDLRKDDLFINTSLSRIWLEMGDKEKAEHFGAQAKILNWKEQLKDPEAANSGINID